MKRIGQLVAAFSALALGAGVAGAQSTPAGCSWDVFEMRLDVTVNGQATTISADWSDGITVNGVRCSEVLYTDTIVVTGSGLADPVTLTGSFAGGNTSEPDFDEIEVVVALAGGKDTLTVNLGQGNNYCHFTSDGLNNNFDADTDIVTAGTEIIKVKGQGGNDEIDASFYTGGGKLYLYGGPGYDALTGSSGADWLYGEDGQDQLRGGPGNDVLDGGTGPWSEELYGEDGNDRFEMGSVPDWPDLTFGGPGVDTADYGDRTTGVIVEIDGLALDGAPTDGDFVDAEKVIGGSGDDTIVGSAANETFTGGAGDDSLYGLDGVDTLNGGDGADFLVGDAGADKLWGDGGDDTLDGGLGGDTLHGGAGSDVLDGGGGNDKYFAEDGDDFLYNNDGISESVDCGAGTDDAEPELSATDVFTGCEL